jgi:hypothetical protein
MSNGDDKSGLPLLPPGSDKAIAEGCICPRMDNGHGRGYLGQAGIYVMREDCPLHGSAESEDKKGGAE